MNRERLLVYGMVLCSISAAYAMNHENIVVKTKINSLSEISQDAFNKRLMESIENQDNAQLAQQAQQLTAEDLTQRKNEIVANNQFKQQIDNYCTAQTKLYKSLHPNIKEREVAEKLKQDLRAHWKRRFKVFYKAAYKDWSHHQEALNQLTNASVDICIAQRPELAILATSDCCVIL